MTVQSNPTLAGKAGVWVLRICLLAVPLFYVPGLYRIAHYPKHLLLQVAALLLLACCAASRRWRLDLRTPFVLPLLLFLAILAFQAIRGQNQAEAAFSLAAFLSYGLLAIAVAALIPAGQVRSLMRFAVAGGTAAALIGVLEHLGVGAAMLPSAGRPSSTFGFRNVGAMYTAACLFYCFALVTGRRRGDLLLGLAGIGTMVPYLLYTRSRGAWLGFAVGCGVWAGLTIWQRKAGLKAGMGDGLRRTRAGAVGAVLVVSLAVGLIPARYVDRGTQRLDEKKTGLVSTLASTAQPGGDRGRLRVWRATMAMVLDHPLAGVGLGNWSVQFPRYDQGTVLALESAPKRPHNDYLWLWAELGPLGLLAFLWTVVAALKPAMGDLRSARAWARRPARFAALAVLALLVHACFSFPSELAAPSLLFWVGLGLAGRETQALRPSRRAACVAAGLGAVLIVLCICLTSRAMRFDRHFLKASLAQDRGDCLTQQAEAEAASRCGIFDHRVLLLLGDALYRQGVLEGACEVYERYVALQPNLAAVRNNLGRVYADLGRFEKAEASYRAGLGVLKGDPVLVNNLAALYKTEGRDDAALAVYQAHGAGTARAEHNLGLILAQRGDYSGAMAAYRRALAMDPGLEEVRYSLAGLEMVTGDLDSAAAGFEDYLASAETHPTYARRARGRLVEIYPVLGDRRLAAGDWGGALHAFKRLADLGGGTATVYNNIAALYRRLGHPRKALAVCDRAIRAFPDSAQVYFTQALLLDETGDSSAALSAYRTFLERGPADERLRRHAAARVSALQP